MNAWRITQRKHAKSAFTGEGARFYGGRWNSPGTPIVYLAQSQSLAILEIFVHLETSVLLEQYVFLEATFNPSMVTELDRSSLPKNWKSDPILRTVQKIGDDWASSGDSAILRIPSALVPDESNFLLNPRHADFAKIIISRPHPFRFDARLTRR